MCLFRGRGAQGLRGRQQRPPWRPWRSGAARGGREAIVGDGGDATAPPLSTTSPACRQRLPSCHPSEERPESQRRPEGSEAGRRFPSWLLASPSLVSLLSHIPSLSLSKQPARDDTEAAHARSELNLRRRVLTPWRASAAASGYRRPPCGIGSNSPYLNQGLAFLYLF